MHHAAVVNAVPRVFLWMLLMAVCCLTSSCSEDSGVVPEAGYVESQPSYSTPEESITKTIEVPTVDLTATVPSTADPTPLSATCGTTIRLAGSLFFDPDTRILSPMAVALIKSKNGTEVVGSSSAGNWGEFDRKTREAQYHIDLRVPLAKGKYKVVISSVVLDSETKEKKGDIPIATYVLDATAK